ncbi:MAG: DUF167 domain-containing protein [Pirellulales bacterium]
MIQFKNVPEGTILPVRAYAGARLNRILGQREGELRVAVSAAPEKGKANQAIVKVLSKALGVPKSSIDLIRGSTSQHKQFLLSGVPLKEARQKIQLILPNER